MRDLWSSELEGQLKGSEKSSGDGVPGMKLELVIGCHMPHGIDRKYRYSDSKRWWFNRYRVKTEVMLDC